MALPLRYNARVLSSKVKTNALPTQSQLVKTTSTRYKSDNNNLILPKYRDIRHIDYEHFRQKLQELNPDFEMSQQKEVHEALKSAVVETIGWKAFSFLKKDNKEVRVKQTNRNRSERDYYNSWSRLEAEEQKYLAMQSRPSGEPIPGEALKLPTYTNVNEIQFVAFRNHLRQLNPSKKDLDVDQVDEAFRKVVLATIGENEAHRLAESNSSDPLARSWMRLREQADKYRKSGR